MVFLPDGGHAVACELGETMPRRIRRGGRRLFRSDQVCLVLSIGRVRPRPVLTGQVA